MTARLDSLESRRLLSASLAGGVLTIVGTESPDAIELDLRSSTRLKVEINLSEYNFDYTQVRSIVIRALGGNDTVGFNKRNPILVGAVIDGGSGDDYLQGSPGADRILGGDGNDHLDGREGNDTLIGGAGNDKLEGKAGRDLLEGGDGDDILQGGDGDDKLFGNAGDDDLYGGAGKDLLKGGSGNDDYLDVLESETHDRRREDRRDNRTILG
jgi:Ca2+-binding RTX toxin-like protein